MEGVGEWEKKLLMSELREGQQCAEQLQNQLPQLGASFPAELPEILVQKIISSFKTALAMLQSNDQSEGEAATQATGVAAGGTDSPHSVSGSPRSDCSDPASKVDFVQERRDISKKRKTLPKWTEQVRVCTGSGMEAPLEDGYSWRKYGQKDILGAKHPRGYYRCTHRNVQGCLATKQVQRSDEDPTIFDITYRGKHSCSPSYHQTNRTASSSSPDKQSSQQLQQQEQQQKQLEAVFQQHQKLGLPHQPNEILLNFKTGLRVKTEGMVQKGEPLSSPLFSFPPTSIDSISTTPESCIFSPSSHLDTAGNFNMHMGMTGTGTGSGSFSPPFISPATSESNYFSMSPCRILHADFVRGGRNIQTSESELTEIISTSTSVTNSPMVDLDFNLEPVEFDPNFPFDASGFFSN